MVTRLMIYHFDLVNIKTFTQIIVLNIIYTN